MDDLTGFEFETDHGLMRVVGPSETCSGYVEVETLDGSFKSVKPAGLVRNTKLFQERSPSTEEV